MSNSQCENAIKLTLRLLDLFVKRTFFIKTFSNFKAVINTGHVSLVYTGDHQPSLSIYGDAMDLIELLSKKSTSYTMIVTNAVYEKSQINTPILKKNYTVK